MDWADRIGRRIKLRDLHILQAVAEQGGIAKAARHLAISQPVISKVIAELEREIGWSLFDRDRHGAQPTIYGAALLKHASAAFDELRQSVKEIEFLADPSVGELRLATNTVLAAGFVSAVIKSLHRRHSGITVHVKLSVLLDALYRDLRERNVDIVVERITTPFSHEDLNAEILYNEATVVVAGRKNRWASRRKVTLGDLVHEPWVFPAEGSAASHIPEEMFRSNGLEVPKSAIVRAPMPVAAALVANGPYLANFPGSLVRFSGKNLPVKVLPLQVPVAATPVGLIALKRRTASPVAQLFVEHARETAKLLAST